MNIPTTQDVLYIGDFFRDSEGIARSVEEARMNALIGLSTGFLHLESKSRGTALNGLVRQLAESGSVKTFDADEIIVTKVAIIIDVELALNARRETPLRVIADRVLVIADRPQSEEHLEFKRVRLREIFGDVITWTATTYDVLAALRAAGLKTTGTIWESFGVQAPNPDVGPYRPGTRPVIGTVIPRGKQHWPEGGESVAGIWDARRYVLRVLGAPPDDPISEQMEVTSTSDRSQAQFVGGLQALVYFPSGRPADLPMLAIGTCLANEIPVLLPPELRNVVGKGPIYVSQSQAPAALHRELGPGRADSVTGFDAGEAHYRRMQSWCGGSSLPNVLGQRTKRAMLFPSNGVGLGHVTRLLSIARRLPEDVDPVFVSLSQAVELIEAAGFTSEMIVSHRYAGLDEANAYPWMEAELEDAIQRYEPDVFVFDGGNPYGFMTNVVAKRRDIKNIWIRRGMWRQQQSNAFVLKKRRFFDGVIEPRDIADDFDRGASRNDRDGVSLVDPILLLDEGDLMSREAARDEMGLNRDGVAVLVQLGAGNNRDLSVTQAQVLSHLQALPGVQIVNLHSSISRFPAIAVPGVRNVRGFPISRYLRAFDFTVSAAGYNTFHELAQSGTPTVFAIRMTSEMDDQLGRARHAERAGWGLVVDDKNMSDLPRMFNRLMDPEVRAAMRYNGKRQAVGNGAADAAELIAEFAR